MSVGFVFSVAPSKGHEILSRKVENDIVEFWYYMRFSLKSIRDLAVGNTMLINRVDEVLSDGLDYKRYLPKLIHLFIFFFFLFFFFSYFFFISLTRMLNMNGYESKFYTKLHLFCSGQIQAVWIAIDSVLPLIGS